MSRENLTTCKRCGRPGRGKDGNPNARILRHAREGVCGDCGIAVFLKALDKLHGGHLFGAPSKALRLPHVQEQIGQLLLVGQSEATLDDIDFERVIEVWNVDDKYDAQVSLF